MIFVPSSHLQLARICAAVHEAAIGNPLSGPDLPDIQMRQTEQVSWATCQVGYSDLLQEDRKVNCICFRGSKSAADFIVDADALMVETNDIGSVHQGFYLDWNTVALDIAKENTPLIICGHSLGGALATLAAMTFDPVNVLEVVTFGCPRVGDAAFAAAYAPLVPQTTRLVFRDDPIPLLPFPQWGYRHVKAPRWWNGTEWQDGQPMFRALWEPMVPRSVLRSWLEQHAIENYIEALETP
jgi:hypothetical protein